MELFELRYALMLSECQNFSRAAEKLFITQPTLSQQIRKLESELGFPLFIRDSRKVVPTIAGERFLEHTTKIIEEYESLQKEVQSIKNMLEGKITFGTSPISSPFISEGIPLFLAKFPQAVFTLLEKNDPDLIDMTARNEIDLAVVSLPHTHVHRDKLRMIPIQEECVCVVLKKGHPLAVQEEVTLEELMPYKLIFSSRRAGLRKIVFSAFKEHGLTPQDTLELTSSEARFPLIMGGAIALALSEQNEWFSHKDLVRIPLAPRIYSTFSLILSKEKHSSFVLDGLIQIMLKEAKKRFEQPNRILV